MSQILTYLSVESKITLKIANFLFTSFIAENNVNLDE